jgi:hypothetical protein
MNTQTDSQLIHQYCSKKFYITLPIQQRLKLEQKCKELGMTPSDYIIHLP